MSSITEIGAVKVNEWTHPRTGEVRLYVQNWQELVGFEVSFYGTGNVSYAAIRGEKIANARATRLLGTKVWIGQDRTVNVQWLPANCRLTEREIIEAVEAAMGAQAPTAASA